MEYVSVLATFVIVGLLFDACDSNQETDETVVLPERVRRSVKVAKSFILSRKKRGFELEDEETEEFDWDEEERGRGFRWRSWEEMQ